MSTLLTPESAAALREQFFALTASPSDPAAAERLAAQLDAIDTPPRLALDGLALSPHPSRRFRTLRFVEAERIPAALRPEFARPSTRMPELAAVFVDPEEFSYRTFENIIPLDRWFEGVELDVHLHDRARLGAGRQPSAYTFALAADEPTRAALLELDGLGLYLNPQNSGSRGGKRFIFHCARLAEALTEAVRAALPKPWLAGFVHVNPVFRCNRFEPGDAPFRRHVDTPYYDAAREQVSKYTLLIYLTGGRGEPALAIGDDVRLTEIPALACVVLPQALEHEGAAYLDGRKVFLRTELIYADAELSHAPDVARLFARACYLTGESVLAPQLAGETHALYDRAAAAHWGRAPASGEAETYIYKRFHGIQYISNGYDYWFDKHVSLQECAAIAVLDLLNCKIAGQAFRKLCESEPITRSEPPSAWIPELLGARAAPPAEPVFCPLDQAALFPPSEAPDEHSCCPFHAWATWDPARCEEVVDLYERAQEFAKRRLGGAAIMVMGEEIFLNLDNIVVEPDKIHVCADQALAPLNFAACWNAGGDPSNYVDVEVTVSAEQLLVPPILYVEHERGVHLMLDLFRNSWMVSARAQPVPIPKFRRLHLEEAFDEDNLGSPWLDAAGFGDEGELDEDEDDGAGPWWADGSAIVRELYADAPGDDD